LQVPGHGTFNGNTKRMAGLYDKVTNAQDVILFVVHLEQAHNTAV